MNKGYIILKQSKGGYGNIYIDSTFTPIIFRSWVEGITEEETLIYYSKDSATKRVEELRKEGYKCQIVKLKLE